MHKNICTLEILILPIIFNVALSSLHNKFSHYQELSTRDFRERVKRNAGGRLVIRQVSFQALGKAFHLLLKPGSPILTHDFVLTEIMANGMERDINLNMDNIYHGTLAGEKDSWVSAAHNLGIWTASIGISDDSYHIEPLRTHDGNGAPESMIIYRGKDVRFPNVTEKINDTDHEERSFCRTYTFPDKMNSSQRQDNRGESEASEKDQMFSYYAPTEGTSKVLSGESQWEEVNKEKTVLNREGNIYRKLNRQPRFTDYRHDTCDLFVVVDYEAAMAIGQGNLYTVVQYLMIIYQNVDHIFQHTKFGVYENIRIMIKRMVVFSSNETKSRLGNFLNQKGTTTDSEVLHNMAMVNEFRHFCAAHLSTLRNLGKGVLGAASHASSLYSRLTNGICSGSAYVSRNVGVSTILDAGKKRLPIESYVDVVAHELGHNFGASHDDEDNPICSPSSADGGKYLMWFRSRTKRGLNHQKFSPCSRKEIAKILKERLTLCLKSGRILRRNKCGNGVVDYIEECDSGNLRMDDPFNCCTPSCGLAKGAVCSPFNHPCCRWNCTIADSSQTCKVDVGLECVQDTYCTGTSFKHCPNPKAKPDGSPCQDGGECHNGECISFCTREGQKRNPPVVLKDCNCDDNRTFMCMHCCVEVAKEQKCRPYGLQYHDGASCLMGVCSHGFCETVKTSTNTLSRFLQTKTVKNDNKGRLKRNGIIITSVIASLVLILVSIVLLWLKYDDIEARCRR